MHTTAIVASMPEDESAGRVTSVRLDPDVRSGIDRVARTEDRSMNWVVNTLTREALRARGVLPTKENPDVQDDW